MEPERGRHQGQESVHLDRVVQDLDTKAAGGIREENGRSGARERPGRTPEAKQPKTTTTTP